MGLLDIIKHNLKKIDKYKAPKIEKDKEDETTATILGGVLTACIPIVILVLLLQYRSAAIAGEVKSTTTTTLMSNVFDGDIGDDNIYFPRMTCINELITPVAM